MVGVMLAPSSMTSNYESGRGAQPLLPLKLTIPPIREGVFLRSDLQSLLPELRVHPVTLVVAPAGYGKTTLVSQWAHDLSRTGAAVCWFSVDQGDRSPSMFLAYLIHTFQRHFPSVGIDAWRILHSAANIEADWPLVAGSLTGDLQRRITATTFLVIDDLHFTSDLVIIGQILGFLLRSAPPNLHIIIASRRMPTFSPLARLRTEGLLLEISQSDLNLTSEQAREVLLAQGVQLSEQELELLLKRTDGWALSVQLAARALADQSIERRTNLLRALSGSQEQILNYLASEVLLELPAEVLEFLQFSSIPSYFDADLLAEVLEREEVEYLLQRSQALGLPILPLDELSKQLRFHPIWRELLQRELNRLQPEQVIKTLQMRFGQAFEARGELEIALDHYASADATDDLARALREHAWPLMASPRRDVIRRWLERIPASTRENDADLLYLWGMTLITSAPEQAIVALEHCSQLYRIANKSDRKLRALADLAALLFLQHRLSHFVAVCVRAVRVANQIRDPWSRGAMLTCVTAILFSKGRYQAALRIASRAAAHPLNPVWQWLLSMIESTINVQLGRPKQALQVIETSLEIPAIDQNDRLHQNLLRQRALALHQQGATDEAASLALAAHKNLANYHLKGVSGFSAMYLSLLLAMEHRVDEAITYIAQARGMFHELGALTELTNLQAIECYVQFMRNQSPQSRGAVSSVLRRLRDSKEASQDLRLWLLLVFVLGESGATAEALSAAQDLIQRMREGGYELFLAVAELYTAYLAEQQNQPEIQVASLERGWQLVEQLNLSYLPILTTQVLQSVSVAAILNNISNDTVGLLLRRQTPDHALAILESLVNERDARIRAVAAKLLGDLGAIGAYGTLKSMQKDSNAQVRAAADDAIGRLVYRPPYTLRIRTLGAFALWRGEQEVRDRDWRSSKARQLFQLLINERGRALPRDRVLDALWPEMEHDAAANNLRVTVNRLSKALEPDRPDGAPPSFILQQGDTYSFNTGSDHTLDSVTFVAAVTEGQRAEQRGHRQAAIAAFQQAIELYGGTYLPDNLYEDWTLVERERLAMLFTVAAIRLATLLLDENQPHTVIGLAWRVIEQDRANEDAYCLLMRAHAALGERSAVVRVYARCVDVLREELGVEPLPETVALFNALRDKA